jgi:GntR family transcriptional regulator/MocR family aminotransferase
VDAEGLVVEQLPAKARVICVTPSHQFPLGTAMSMRRRAALLELARARGAVVIEDDYDAEFRYGGRPLDALQTLDRAESVFYVGTFSKSLFPDLRLGFVVVPVWARQAFVAAKHCSDGQCPQLSQDTLAAFIAEGHLARHVRKMRQVYDERRQVLLDGLQREFGRWLDPIPSAAGLHLSALTRPSVDADDLVERATKNGIGLYPLRLFEMTHTGRPGLVFGYGTIEKRAISEALWRLRRVWR